MSKESGYKKPARHHDVVEDISTLSETFKEIDTDAVNLDNVIDNVKNFVGNQRDTFIYSGLNIENPTIEGISPEKYITINDDGTGFVCIESSGTAGGFTGQCSVKKTEANFDITYGDITDVSKNGILIRENTSDGVSGRCFIFKDETEIDNDAELPKRNVISHQVTTDFELYRNESAILKDEYEPFYETVQLATNINYGIAKIGTNIDCVDGVISKKKEQTATKNRLGVVQIGDGFDISESGTLMQAERTRADKNNFGVVKLGNNFKINNDEEMELADMTKAPEIYGDENIKIVGNGVVDLEENVSKYRTVINSDIVFTFNLNFIPQQDFSFTLEILSDGVHLINFNEKIQNMNQNMPVNRGTTRITFTKKLGYPHYEAIVDRNDAPAPELLTPSNGGINSDFLIICPRGASCHPSRILSNTSNTAYTCPRIRFEFETLISVDYVYYRCGSNTDIMKEFTLKGSADGKNWTILLHRTNTVIYGNVYTDRKGCFRYYELTINSSGDSTNPRQVLLYGNKISNNETSLKCLTPFSSSSNTSYFKFTASKIAEGSVSNMTDNNFDTYIKITADSAGDRWAKYEFPEPVVANLLQIFIGDSDYSKQAIWFRLEASNDDIEWVNLLERQYLSSDIFVGKYNMLFYKLTNEIAYKYYRLKCIATNNIDASWLLDGFKLYQRHEGRNVFYNDIPVLKSDSDGSGYVVSYNSRYNTGHAGWYAFDNNLNTRWGTAAGVTFAWIQLKLPNAEIFKHLSISSRNDEYYAQCPTEFEIQGSNDGSTFTTIASFKGIGWMQADTRYFSFENDTAYLYYRIYTPLAGCAISRVRFGHYEGLTKKILDKYEHVIPVFGTSYTTTDEKGTYKLTYSSQHETYKAYGLFNHSYSSKFELASGNKSGWVQVEFPIPTFANVLRIASRNDSWANAAPRDYTLKGSNDGSSWSTLFSVANSSSFSSSELRTHQITTPDAYKFYRLEVSNPGNSVLTFACWEMMHRYTITEY